MRGVAAASLGLVVAAVGGLRAQQPGQPLGGAPPEHKAGDLPGPIDSIDDLQDTARMLFKMADTNNDGQISQKEAVDVGNLLVGGFFFRADQNGDGVLSKEEARAAREALFQQKPMLRVVMERAKREVGRDNNAAGRPGPAGSPVDSFRNIASLLDANNDQQIQASEVRQAVQTTVQALFASADTNRDGQLSPTELNAAVIGMARAAEQAAFAAADTNHDGRISREEFDKAIVEPANVIFAVLDANGDGQISPDEAQQARRVVAQQLMRMRLPEAPNSPRNLIRTGQPPDQVAPVPNIAAPRTVGTPPPPARPR